MISLVWTLALLAAGPSTAVDPLLELQTGRNEYAYGDCAGAVARIKPLLQPLQLTQNSDLIEAHKVVGLCAMLADRTTEARLHFEEVLFLDPDYELDPFSIAPPTVAFFEDLKQKLKPQLDVIRRQRAEALLPPESLDSACTPAVQRVREHSEFATFLPFGIGQFQNGDTFMGIVFAAAEAALLAINISSHIYVRARGDYQPRDAGTVQALIVTQYASAGLFGLAWSIGVLHARIHFVPETTVATAGPGRMPPARRPLLARLRIDF
jgi:hypothetical protein